ncbi:hypothetical protein ABIA39_000150 [Nocardia sp. GAS34]|uniref:hypothetical protein n=1 Tax=unclassified Nocardia TaxID=2637762 RepID=UPI003D2044DA
MTRLAVVLTVAALMAIALCAGSGSATCAAAGSPHHHRTSVVRVERCAAAGFRSLVDR